MSLLMESLRLGFRRVVEYRASFLTGVVVLLFEAGAFLMFWKIIFHHFETIGGWDFPTMVLFLGYDYLFFGLILSIFDSAHYLGDVIRGGGLDMYLVRPRNTLLLHTLKGIWLYSNDIAVGLVFILLATKLGLSVSIPAVIGGVVLTFFSAYLFSIMLSTLSMLAFWLGKGISELLWPFIWGFGDYPTFIFGKLVPFLKFVVPVFFVATGQVMIVRGAESFIRAGSLLGALILAWYAIRYIVFSQGLKVYGGYGG